MPIFTLAASDLVTGAVVGTYKSLMGIKMPNTAGNRGRVRKVHVFPAAEAPQDVNVNIVLTKSSNAADGTATAATSKKANANTVATLSSLLNKNYTVEPTTVDSQSFWEGAVNGRGGAIMEWAEGKGPLWGINETLLLRASPGSAVAVKLAATIEWEDPV